MLSKLRYFQAHAALPDPSLDWTDLDRHFEGRLGPRRPVPDGTLGAGFRARLDGREIFLKTHRPAGGIDGLRRERLLLRAVHGELPLVDYLETADPVIGRRGWLLLTALEPPADPVAPEQVGRLIGDFDRIAEIAPATIPPGDNLALLLEMGWQALAQLDQQGLLASPVSARVRASLQQLAEALPRMSRVPCHGDLGPANILAWRDGLVAIDWEDAFWGIEGYDFLYWLSFMSNRRHCTADNIGRTRWGRDMEVALLAMIVLLKCHLSVLRNQQQQLSMSFDERLLHILCISG